MPAFASFRTPLCFIVSCFLSIAELFMFHGAVLPKHFGHLHASLCYAADCVSETFMFHCCMLLKHCRTLYAPLCYAAQAFRKSQCVTVLCCSFRRCLCFIVLCCLSIAGLLMETFMFHRGWNSLQTIKLNPSIVRVESNLCATIHWGSSCAYSTCFNF